MHPKFMKPRLVRMLPPLSFLRSRSGSGLCSLSSGSGPSSMSAGSSGRTYCQVVQSVSRESRKKRKQTAPRPPYLV